MIEPGTTFAPRVLEAVDGAPVAIPDARRRVHLQLRRFAGCPVCNLHLRTFADRAEAIAAAGILEVAVFHSSADVLRPYVRDLPFAVLADPDKVLYRELGVGTSGRAIADPRAWPTIAVSVGRTLRGDWPAPPAVPEGGRFGLPADFLIGTDGRVIACHYGVHADDQWTVDELLAK